MIALSDKAWSPYVAGALIGLLQIPAFLLMDTGLGASSSFVKAAGHAALIFDPMAVDGSYFSKYITSSKYVWQSALVIGIALGAFLSMRLSSARREHISPVWREAMGVSSPLSRYGLAFLGGFILLFGARLAGGCTSGHGLTGLAQLAVSSSIVVPSIFAGGIAAAFIFTRRF